MLLKNGVPYVRLAEEEGLAAHARLLPKGWRVMMREAQVERVTGETKVKISLNLDGSGAFEGKTGVGFLDHMLHLLARHALIDLRVEAVGDLYVDAHHTVEDIGICLGMALQKALGDKKGSTGMAALCSLWMKPW